MKVNSLRVHASDVAANRAIATRPPPTSLAITATSPLTAEQVAALEQVVDTFLAAPAPQLLMLHNVGAAAEAGFLNRVRAIARRAINAGAALWVSDVGVARSISIAEGGTGRVQIKLVMQIAPGERVDIGELQRAIGSTGAADVRTARGVTVARVVANEGRVTVEIHEPGVAEYDDEFRATLYGSLAQATRGAVPHRVRVFGLPPNTVPLGYAVRGKSVFALHVAPASARGARPDAVTSFLAAALRSYPPRMALAIEHMDLSDDKFVDSLLWAVGGTCVDELLFHLTPGCSTLLARALMHPTAASDLRTLHIAGSPQDMHVLKAYIPAPAPRLEMLDVTHSAPFPGDAAAMCRFVRAHLGKYPALKRLAFDTESTSRAGAVIDATQRILSRR